MAFSISSTTTPAPEPARGRGFTLVEVLIGTSIGSIVLAGVLTAFTAMVRGGVLLYNYSGMSLEARRTLEEFGQDVRMATAVTWNSSSSVTLTVPDNYASTANQVTYAHDASTSGAFARTFFRKAGTAADAATTTGRAILARNVQSCTFHRFDRLDATATNDASTKRLELALEIRTAAPGAVTASQSAISASFVLRNKTAN